MTYFLWALPTLVLLAAIISGRCSTTAASLMGLATTVPIALFWGPLAFDSNVLFSALLRGLWIGAVIAPYILGGLLFWQVAARNPAGSPSAPADKTSCSSGTEIGRRRLVFFACFLLGPFAESATGFGVGMLGTVMMIRHLGFAPRHLMIFALMSQTVIPWGAMSSGTLLAAAYARIPPELLGVYCVGPVALLMSVWLPLFWRTARAAGIAAPLTENVREVAWIGTCMALLALGTMYLGPETALLAAYGPIILVRYLLDFRPNRAQAKEGFRKVLPYVLLIGGLALVRLWPEAKRLLSSLARLTPYEDLPAWSPFFHAGSWLLVGALCILIARRQITYLRQEVRTAWSTGQHAVLTVFTFSMMAEVLTASGISGAFATLTFDTLGEKALLLTPVLSGTFGVLTNSGNPANSLFLPSQVALALQAGLSIPAVASLQQVSGMSMGLFSPVRMSIAAGLAKGHGQERAVYLEILPFALVALCLLMGVAIWVIH